MATLLLTRSALSPSTTRSLLLLLLLLLLGFKVLILLLCPPTGSGCHNGQSDRAPHPLALNTPLTCY
jgi:hypothetical protein